MATIWKPVVAEDDGARQHEHGGDGVERHHDGAVVDAIGQHASERESRMVGTMEMASTEAKMVAEPVSSSTPDRHRESQHHIAEQRDALSGDQQHEVAGQQRALGGGAHAILGFHCAIHSEAFLRLPCERHHALRGDRDEAVIEIGTPIASSMVAKQRMRCSISGRVTG